jgi:preprotein translocase subunit SecG
LSTLFVVIHIITCIFLILFVLIQSGKGSDMGSAFGGMSQTYFGTKGGNILTKITTVLAVVFMITSIILTVIQHRKTRSTVMEEVKTQQTKEDVKK